MLATEDKRWDVKLVKSLRAARACEPKLFSSSKIARWIPLLRHKGAVLGDEHGLAALATAEFVPIAGRRFPPAA